MNGNNTIVMCQSALYDGLETYLNEHVFTKGHEVKVTDVEQDESEHVFRLRVVPKYDPTLNPDRRLKP